MGRTISTEMPDVEEEEAKEEGGGYNVYTNEARQEEDDEQDREAERVINDIVSGGRREEEDEEIEEVDDEDVENEDSTIQNSGGGGTVPKSDGASMDPSASTGSAMDFSLAMGLTLGSGMLKPEDTDLMPYYQTSKRSRSSGKTRSSNSRLFADADIGSQYYTREPSAALNRLSGGLKYNGKWSGTMSDILGAGMESTGSGSQQGLLSLVIPEMGGRGTYSNSISPLGITLTTPCASPRTALSYTHRGFQSPHASLSMTFDRS